MVVKPPTTYPSTLCREFWLIWAIPRGEGRTRCLSQHRSWSFLVQIWTFEKQGCEGIPLNEEKIIADFFLKRPGGNSGTQSQLHVLNF